MVFWRGQGNQGYNAAALNAHEARMGKSLAIWRMFAQNLFVVVFPICAYVFMHHPSFAERAAEARDALLAIGDDTIRSQVSTTVAARYFLPHGLIGGLCAVMLGAFISTHDTYLHSWGSIFVQDVILPFRKNPLSQKEHIRWIKISIFGVAIFIFIFSLVFRQSEAIVMFFQITGAIFFGGAGSIIIGGLYWRRGTTQGAWAAMTTGALLAVLAIILKQVHLSHPFSNKVIIYIATMNGAYQSFLAQIAAIVAYVSVSLATCHGPFNLEKMLHRGEYEIESDKTTVSDKEVSRFCKLVGINKDFNFRDKVVYLVMLFWTLGLVAVFIGLTAANIMNPMSDGFWFGFWKWYIVVSLVLGAISTVWFVVGGAYDIKKMFSRLANRTLDEVDDGRVD